ncbi:MAG TPA: protein-L-isoaspartate(D-aspartate) O-methyltransferase [Stellaceae bacterium]|nr:protein-L-isoaspartate(D-aspartate) O-methyltransferase [Stellaceae bacterium]
MRPLSDRDALIAEIEIETAETAPLTGRRKLSARLLAALRKVPREAFIPEADIAHAYVNTPLPIGHGQTISQPFVVAIMTELLDLEPDHSVLEIGTGSGYQAAILAELARQVWSVEVVPDLAETARAALAKAGYGNVEIRCGDGALGWPEHAPYDAIIVTAATPLLPPALLAQLKPGGRLIAPVGAAYQTQTLTLVEKSALSAIAQRAIMGVAFVPLVSGCERA